MTLDEYFASLPQMGNGRAYINPNQLKAAPFELQRAIYSRGGTVDINQLRELAPYVMPTMQFQGARTGQTSERTNPLFQAQTSQTQQPQQQPTNITPLQPNQPMVNPNAPTQPPQATNAVPVQQYMGQQVQTPGLPQNTSLVPVLLQPNQNEFLDPNMANLGQQQLAQTATIGTPAQAQAAQVNTGAIMQGLEGEAPQVTAATTQSLDGMTQEQLDASRQAASVQNQLATLLDFEPGTEPPWAKAAMRVANEAMAERGLGQSSIAGSAITATVMESATQIAVADAQLAQQRLLSDVAAVNTARQINASNGLQLKQFRANLLAQIEEQNANRSTTISQWNAAAINQAKQYDAEAQNITSRFNSQIANERQMFETKARLEIDQANVVWRRNINTANTAALNAANQFNVTNRFNMSQTALNNLWQQWRDEATWAYQSSENQANRAFNIAMASNNRQWINDQYAQQRDYQAKATIAKWAMSELDRL